VSPAIDPRRARLVLLVAALVPLATTALLRQGHVPLGCPGRFVYLYSPIAAYRLAALPAAVALAVVLGAGTWLAGAGSARRRRWSLTLLAGGAIALAVWAYVAPPYFRNQHIFNAESPSQDGAFVQEALRVTSLREYLYDFPRRAQMPPAAMRGTRVVSNPPGATLVAVGVERLVQRFPLLRELALGPLVHELPPTESVGALQHTQAVGLVFFWVLSALWVLAAGALYWLARLFLPPATAAAYALCCVFTPATLLLTPGKDPAQLLTVALPLYLWLRAVRRDRVVPAVLAGLLLPLVCLVGLVHLWMAAIALAATWLAAEQRRNMLLRLALPAGVAAVLGTLGLYLLCNVDLIAIVRSVARAQAEVTRGPNAMPLAWQLLGVPLFLLFVGPAWWTTTAWAALPRLGLHGPVDRDTRLGRYLLIAAPAVMLATVAFTNLETPRLWIPFTPLLLLGALLQLGALRRPDRRVALLLALLVAVQVVAASLQWSLMDMREAETRLVEQRFFG
jgi:hypothetical protein